jgi:hypothetical protein
MVILQQPRHFNQNPGYLPNGAAGGHTGLPPGATPLLPNNGRIVQTGGVRVLCIADVRGKIGCKPCDKVTLTACRKFEISQRSCEASSRGSYYPYRRLWFL